MKFAWLPCSLILRQEQGSEKETAEVNTPKGLVVCQGRSKYSQKTMRKATYLIIGKHVLTTEFPEQVTHSGVLLSLSSTA